MSTVDHEARLDAGDPLWMSAVVLVGLAYLVVLFVYRLRKLVLYGPR